MQKPKKIITRPEKKKKNEREKINSYTWFLSLTNFGGGVAEFGRGANGGGGRWIGFRSVTREEERGIQLAQTEWIRMTRRPKLSFSFSFLFFCLLFWIYK